MTDDRTCIHPYCAQPVDPDYEDMCEEHGIDRNARLMSRRDPAGAGRGGL